jgi:cysteine-rich repeat protein
MRRLVVAAAAGVVAWVAFACGDPAAPELPQTPDSGPSDIVVTDCTGIADGTKCGNGAKICLRGACADPACGDGIVTAPEECDQGANNVAGAGCEPGTCKFSCLSTDKARNCEIADGCMSATCDDAKHSCNAATQKPVGASCGPSKYCKGTECVQGECGDAVVTTP